MAQPRSAGGIHSLVYTLKMFWKLGFSRLWQAMIRKNACKTCALGMGGQEGGMRNEAGRFPEFCKKSLQAMQSDMQGSIARDFFKQTTIEDLKQLSPRELDALGRIDQPLYAAHGDKHFSPITYDQALEKVAAKLKDTPPEKSFFYFSGRSSNEAGFLLQLLARNYGTNHVNNCSYYCHQASGVGLSDALGTGAATINLEDAENADLFFLIGGNPTSNHPRLLTSLMHLKEKGGKVIVINPLIEPGLVKFKIPSHVKSLLFGTKIADHYVQPKIGGDLALLSGMAKAILETEAEASHFIENHTEGFSEFKVHAEKLTWEDIEDSSGLGRYEILELAKVYLQSKNTVFAWTMGVTHHLHGVGNVQSIVNLALLRGMVGKPHAGLLPLRGHSNVQGMGTVGVTPKLKKQVFENIENLGLKPPTFEGYDTMSCMEASHKGEMNFAFCLGGNLYGSNPDTKFASEALAKIDLMVQLNTTLNQGHVHGMAKEMIILPVLARDEEAQATTQESMFNYVRYSDGGPERLQKLRSEIDIIADLGSRLFGDDIIKWREMTQHQNIRQLMAKTIPGLENLATIDQDKKEFTIPRRIHHQPKFATESGKAQFRIHPIPEPQKGLTLMTIRSEGQFNTVVFEEEDAFRGIKKRDVILLNEADIKERHLNAGDKVRVSSEVGELSDITVTPYDIRRGCAMMYYPEANVLVPRTLDPLSKTPAFKSVAIQIERSVMN